MRLSREQSLSPAKWIRERHPLTVGVGEAGAGVAELANQLGLGSVPEDECIEWGAGLSNKYGAINVILLGETINVGETSHLAKLAQAQVDDIRARYVKGNRWHPGNGAELREEYGISPANLGVITRGQTWRH
jgi:hypothetical protein